MDRPGTVPLRVTDEVAEALRTGAPVVALESNVITHGLDYPENAATARKVEAAVRAGGAVPATIGVDAGRVLLGMTDADIDRFASGAGIPKVSSRDLAVVLASGGPGATTVASSLVLAHLAGIPFLASAGMGGVHRGAQRTMDISADLIQLTRSPVALVCAGAKTILDLGLTLEYLETQCVPVISYGSDDFPAFYCVSSGLPSPHRLDDEAAVARAVHTHWALGNPGSVLVATPIDPADAVDKDEVDAATEQAMAAAERAGITGNALTRHLMRAVDRSTGGRAARANTAVLAGTAELAGRVAVAYARLRQDARDRGGSA